MAMRRISWVDQRISDAVALFWLLPGGDVSFFFGGDGLARCRIAAAIMAKASMAMET
jgi:hypothetical protein